MDTILDCMSVTLDVCENVYRVIHFPYYMSHDKSLMLKAQVRVQVVVYVVFQNCIVLVTPKSHSVIHVIFS